MAMPSTNPPKTSENLFGKALREALLAGVISLGLFTLYIGLKTDQNIRNELILTQRWGMLAVFVALAMVGRFLMVAYVQPWSAARKATKAEAVGVAEDRESFFKRNFSKIAIVEFISKEKCKKLYDLDDDAMKGFLSSFDN